MENNKLYLKIACPSCFGTKSNRNNRVCPYCDLDGKTFIEASVNEVKNFIHNLCDEDKRNILEGIDPMHSSSAVFVVNNRNELLIIKRRPGDYWMAGKYGLPGGLCDKNENPLDGAARETREETGLILSKMKLHSYETVQDVNLKGNPIEINYYVYWLSHPGTEISLSSEHTEYRWVSFEELKNMDDLVPGIIDRAEKILTHYRIS